MAKTPLTDTDFERLRSTLVSETTSVTDKFNKLYYSKGYFTGLQAATILACYKTAPERVQVIKALKKRLCRMTCAEAAEILKVIQLTNYDRIFALDCIKHTLIDHETTEGVEYILKAFVYETDKIQALRILSTVSMYVSKELASGGHQMYAPFGGLYTQCFPGREALYGPISEQLALKDHEVKPSLPVTVRTNLPQSIFHAAPSYVYTGDDNRSWYPGGGKPPLPPSISESVITGPPKLLDENRSDYLIENAPTCPDNNLCLSINQVAPEPTGFPSIHKPEETDCC